MIGAFLALAILIPQSVTVEDYFPLREGDEWVYDEVTKGRTREMFTDTVGETIEIEGVPATAIVTTAADGSKESTYYRVVNNKVFVIAFDPKSPIKDGYAIIDFGSPKNKWDFVGETSFMGAKAALELKASWKKAGSREVEGEKRELIEVTLDAVVVDTEASGAAGMVVGVKTKQVSTYAKGIGLIEMKEEAQMGRSKSERVRTLRKFTAKT